MKSTDTSFEDVSGKWAEHEHTVRGALRYDLSHENIEIYLSGERQLRILDLGAGTGPDSAWLAQKGHSVVAVEPSASNLEIANERFAKVLTKKERNRITTVQGYAETLVPSRYAQKFDWAISHCVAISGYLLAGCLEYAAQWRLHVRFGKRICGHYE